MQYAAVMGIQKDLQLIGNEFSNIATFLFVGLLCFELLNSMLMTVPRPAHADVNSLFSSKDSSSEVAWFERHSLGNCYSQWCCSNILPRPSCLPCFLGFLRSDHWPFTASYQLAVVH